MTAHDDIIDLLAVRRDLSAEEARRVDAHLADCAMCSRVAQVYARQDAVLRPLALSTPPASIRATVQEGVRADHQRRIRMSFPSWRWLAAGSTAIAACIVAVLLLITSPRTATPVSASVIHLLTSLAERAGGPTPYSGTSIVSSGGHGLSGNFPAASQIYSSPYRARVSWAVGDARHYRIDVTTLLPALQAGTVTYVRNGEHLLIYDHRSERATETDLSAEDRANVTRRFLGVDFSPLLLARLLGGGTLTGPSPPTPTETLGQYLKALRTQGGPQQPPEFARVAGSGSVAGVPVDVVEFGPLARSDYITGCSFRRPGHCVHHPSGTGVERIWVDLAHRTILGYQLLGLPGEGQPFQPVPSMRVTGVRYGVGPTRAALYYTPPTPTRHVSAFTSGNGEGTGLPSGAPPPLFVPAGPSPTMTNVSVPQFYEWFIGPAGGWAEMDQVWNTGKLGHGDIVIGRYLEVQEFVQVHGLPRGLRAGTRQVMGRCTGYTGRYADGQHWLAIQHGKVSVLVSSNALSVPQLVKYAGTSLCGR